MEGDTKSISSRGSQRSRRSVTSNTTTLSSGSVRQQWGNQAEFILTCVGYAVGLGNVWRFPYLTYRNGGGAFLIPYWFMLIFVGVPLFFLELSIGQFSSQGPISCWTLNPLMKGLGYSMLAVNTCIAIYYNIIVAWCLYYFFASMARTLPWATCDNWWNTYRCVAPDMYPTLRNMTDENGTITYLNFTFTLAETNSPSEEYFYNNVLRLSTGMGEAGTIVWQLACMLLFAWLVIFFVLIKGISSLGKVVYFSSIFPYILMTVMVARGCTLDGAYTGVMYYLTPDWDRLSDARVWSDAATQIFYSLSACTGGLIAMASYNDFHNNHLRDSIIVPVINCLTSFYSGFAIFSVLGFMAERKGVTVDEVAASGPGLVFVVYPEGLQQLPVSPVWSVLFFFMMMTLGFSSEFSITEGFFAAMIDEFQPLKKSRAKQMTFRVLGTIVFYCVGLCMITEGGYYVFNIIDTYLSGFPLLFCGLFEFIAISYVYGYFKFADDVAIMLGKRPSGFFAATWMVISPLILLVTIILLAIGYAPVTLDAYEYPRWAQGVGWMFVSLTLLPIPLYFFWGMCEMGAAKLLYKNGRPTPEWGPAKARDRKGTKYERRSKHKVKGITVTAASGHLNGGVIPDGNLQEVKVDPPSYENSFQKPMPLTGNHPLTNQKHMQNYEKVSLPDSSPKSVGHLPRLQTEKEGGYVNKGFEKDNDYLSLSADAAPEADYDDVRPQMTTF